MLGDITSSARANGTPPTDLAARKQLTSSPRRPPQQNGNEAASGKGISSPKATEAVARGEGVSGPRPERPTRLGAGAAAEEAAGRGERSGGTEPDGADADQRLRRTVQEHEAEIARLHAQHRRQERLRRRMARRERCKQADAHGEQVAALDERREALLLRLRSAAGHMAGAMAGRAALQARLARLETQHELLRLRHAGQSGVRRRGACVAGPRGCAEAARCTHGRCA